MAGRPPVTTTPSRSATSGGSYGVSGGTVGATPSPAGSPSGSAGRPTPTVFTVGFGALASAAGPAATSSP